MKGKRGAKGRRLEQWERLRPRTAVELDRFIQGMFGVRVPRRARERGSSSPFEYLGHAFFEEGATRDVVVWANRGGGKTYYGAMATLLDLVFKPGVQVRILGGSREQSEKMYGYLLGFLKHPRLRPLLKGEATQRRVELIQGSVVEVLSQSARSVRGQRVHKLRCDEVELFKEEVWEAAQLVTRSGWCGATWVVGAVEAMSTMHEPFGLMSRILDRVRETKGARILRWNLVDVLERCPAERVCEGCELWGACGGRAKRGRGFVGIEDAIVQKQRVSRGTWESEVLCVRPTVRESVYSTFDQGRHVVDGEVADERGLWIGGMDFGYRNPTVMLWGRVVEDGVLEIVDEYVAKELTLEEHLEVIEGRGWPEVAWIGVDPAGGQRNGQTGVSDIQVLRRHGYSIRQKRSLIRQGIEMLRRRLDTGKLRVHERCGELLRGLQGYHYDWKDQGKEEPVKDGADHVCDALRYMVVNLEGGNGGVEMRQW